MVSAAGHSAAAVLLLVVLGEPKLFQVAAPEAIAVDLVTPQELRTADEGETRPHEAKSDAQTPSAVSPEPEQTRQDTANEADADTRQASQPTDEAAARSAAQVGWPQPGFVDTRELLALYNMRLPGSGFDAPATSQANLTRDEAARFRAEVQRCWHLPPGLASSSARVVLRISLNPDGTLAAEPMLIEATASRDGPQVMRAAIEAVRQCQPFASLPRDRYREWKQLDVSFTPRDMVGG